MLRNSILYHRFWYFRKRTSRVLNIYIRLIVIFLILALLVMYANKKLMPCLEEISEHKARSMVTMSINSIVNDVFDDSVEYNDIIEIKRDGSGKITSIETNIAKLNKLSSTVTYKLQEEMIEPGKDKVSIPFGSILGNSIFAGTGPDLNITIKQMGNVETEYKSEFISGGINQTIHRIYIRVRTNIRIIGPITNRKHEIATEIPVAETIIVGSVPGIYLNGD
ncbi:MAG: sporulation protein YunB [Acetivibrionales bacterium]|jgi:sporulation protein YunB